MLITDENSIMALLSEIKPTVIFHTFSPKFVAAPKTLWEGNVVGTSILLKCALAATSVQALVYSSSDSVMETLGTGETILTEASCRIINPEKKDIDAYRKTKAIADSLVLKANSPALRTVSLRFGTMYGPGDTQNLPMVLEQLRQKQTNIQIGPNKTPREYTYIPSNAYAHVLAAQALLHGQGLDGERVDGEVFFVSDKENGEGAMMFWDWMCMVWKEAGDKTTVEERTVVPIWVAMFFIGVMEWGYWVGTLGRSKPDVTRATASYMFMPVRMDISKAVRRLGFCPLVGVEEGVRKSVEWMKVNGWKGE
jgi:sterol-4alpha-carboxylate 3-dehydrogenase (decarboxylating)